MFDRRTECGFGGCAEFCFGEGPQSEIANMVAASNESAA
jgi:hypothetical protein